MNIRDRAVHCDTVLEGSKAKRPTVFNLLITSQGRYRSIIMKYPLPQITTEPGMATAARSAKQMYVPAWENNPYALESDPQNIFLCYIFTLDLKKTSQVAFLGGVLSYWLFDTQGHLGNHGRYVLSRQNTHLDVPVG